MMNNPLDKDAALQRQNMMNLARRMMKASPENRKIVMATLEKETIVDLLQYMTQNLPDNLKKDAFKVVKTIRANWKPVNDDQLWQYISDEIEIRIPRNAVCEGHCAPFDFVADAFFERGILDKLIIGNRGSGKTHLSGILHGLNAKLKPKIEAVSAGAIENQAKKCYEYFKRTVMLWPDFYNKRDVKIRESNFPNGSKVEIVIGCLPEHAMVITPNGRERIGKIVANKLPGPVQSYNFETEEFEWCEVTDWYSNGFSEGWLRFVLEDSTLQSTYDLTCTNGHLLVKPDGSKAPASDFKAGDMLWVNTDLPSEEQEQIMMGMLLGDGHVMPKWRFRMSQTKRKIDYLRWFADSFSEYNPTWGRRDSHSTMDIDLKSTRYFHRLRREWYHTGSRRVPDYVWDKLNLLGLACWLMDDGCWIPQFFGGVWSIATHNFNQKERDKVTEFFNTFGIAGQWDCVSKEKDQYMWKTIEGSGNFLQALVADFIDVSEHQGHNKGYKRWIADPIKEHSRIGGQASPIKRIDPYDGVKYQRYDITVPKNSNYVVSSGLVISNTMSGVNSPHPNIAHLDEIELLRPGIFEESANMAQSSEKIVNGEKVVYRAQNWLTSSWKKPRGLVTHIFDQIAEAKAEGRRPPYDVYRWCVMESSQPCEHDCQACPFADYIKDRWVDGSQRSFESVCKQGSRVEGEGRLKRSDGFIPVEDTVNKFMRLGRRVWEAQQESKRPTAEGLVYEVFDEDIHGVENWEPDPNNGLIDVGLDFGGKNPFAAILFQTLNVEVLHNGRRFKEGSVIAFDEVYKANIGNITFGLLLNERILYWENRYPGFMESITGFYRDVAAKAAAIDLRHLGQHGDGSLKYRAIPTIARGHIEVDQSIAFVEEVISDGEFYIDTGRCVDTLNEFLSYEYPEGKNSGSPIKENDHAMDALRYRFWNVKLATGRGGTGKSGYGGANGASGGTGGPKASTRYRTTPQGRTVQAGRGGVGMSYERSSLEPARVELAGPNGSPQESALPKSSIREINKEI